MSPFRCVFLFFLFLVFGFFLLSDQDFENYFVQKNNDIVISFSCLGQTSNFIEEKCTSIIENALSKVTEVKSIRSHTTAGEGNVSLTFARSVEIEKKRFEIANIIRSVYKKLPHSTSYPIVNYNSKKSKSENPILVYAIEEDDFRFKSDIELLKDFHNLVYNFSGIDVSISSMKSFVLDIKYDAKICEIYDIGIERLIDMVQSLTQNEVYLKSNSPGNIQMKVVADFAYNSIEEIRDFVIKQMGGRIIRLGDVAKLTVRKNEETEIIRYNGKPVKMIFFKTKDGVDSNRASDLIRKKVKNYSDEVGIPVKLVSVDAKIGLDVQNRILNRLLLSLLLVAVAGSLYLWSFKRIAIWIICICATISIVPLVFFILRLNLTHSDLVMASLILGGSLVNLLVTIKYSLNGRHLQMIIGSFFVSLIPILSTYFNNAENDGFFIFLPLLFSINIASSLSSIFLVPALFRLFSTNMSSKFSRREGRFNFLYRKLEDWFVSFRISRSIVLASMILVFGTPFFLLPTQVDDKNLICKVYNSILGNSSYLTHIRPYVDKFTGGLFRLFYINVFEKTSRTIEGSTEIIIEAKLPNGHNGIDFALKKMEAIIDGSLGVKDYHTIVRSPTYGVTTVIFNEGESQLADMGDLKSRLIAKSLELSGVDWEIRGLGGGFSTGQQEETPSFSIQVKGYNFSRVSSIQEKIVADIKQNPRVQKVTATGLATDSNTNRGYSMTIDNLKLASYGIPFRDLVEQISFVSEIPTNAQLKINSYLYKLKLSEGSYDSMNMADFKSRPLHFFNKPSVHLEDISTITTRSRNNDIVKEDRNYIKFISFEYIGDRASAIEYIAGILEKHRDGVPAGFSMDYKIFSWNMSSKVNSYFIIFAVVLVFFITGCIYFESFKKAFWVILAIPASFLGVFLFFLLTEDSYNLGGHFVFYILSSVSICSVMSIYFLTRYMSDIFSRGRIKAVSLFFIFRILLSYTVAVLACSTPLILSYFTDANNSFQKSFSGGMFGGTISSLVFCFLFFHLSEARNRF